DAADRAALIHPALIELAKRDAAKARAWLGTCTDAEDRKVAEKAVRIGMVEADPLRAVELAGSLENRREARELLTRAATRAASIGNGTLRRLATTEMQPWMIPSVIYEFSRLDPAMAVDLAIKAGTSMSLNDSAFQNAFSALAKIDPAQAIAKIEEL